MKKIFVLFLGFIPGIFTISGAQTPGCTDPAANNHNPSASLNDGSCTYNSTTLNPVLKYTLSSTLNENSGLLWWNENLWTHNDGSGAPVLYAIDSSTGNIVRTVAITNAVNVDWEDLAQDADYIYIGDCGNNASGNRTDLKIYRISKNDIQESDNVIAGIINFSFEDQTDFTPQGANNTNFDCEAIIAYESNLYLFTRNWIDKQTNLYELSKMPGTHTALKKGTLNVQGLISGAEIVADRRTIVLTGYSTSLSPFIYLLYDFANTDFFAANKRKVPLNATFTQMEGIAMIRPEYFFVSNERFLQFPIDVPAQFQTIDVSALLNPYYTILPITFIDLQAKPSGDDVALSWQIEPAEDADSYEVERKTNTENRFITIQTLRLPKNHFVDRAILPKYKVVHYRLKVTDIDNRIYYSEEAVIKGKWRNNYEIHSSRRLIQVIAPPGDMGTIEIFANDGSLKIRKQIASTTTMIDIAFLPAGIYFVRVMNKDRAQTLKFLKQ